jgi:hypothetical protein
MTIGERERVGRLEIDCRAKRTGCTLSCPPTRETKDENGDSGRVLRTGGRVGACVANPKRSG